MLQKKKKKKKDQRLIVKQKNRDNKNFNQIFKKNKFKSKSKPKLGKVLTHFSKTKISTGGKIQKNKLTSKSNNKHKLKLRPKKTKVNLKTKLTSLIKDKDNSKNISKKSLIKKSSVKKRFIKKKNG